ncbi:MAG: septum site-determining protein MinC [Gammaproteobacteria bacterium]|nr:MAG: septum site-determining protein MinC [Gammaproteobacteria bacterium]
MTKKQKTRTRTKESKVGFFGKMLTFSRLKLTTNDLNEIEEILKSEGITKESQIPVIIESTIKQNLKGLVELLWQCGLQPIGIVTGEMDEQAKQLRLAIFPADGKRIERIKPKPSDTKHSNDKDKIVKPTKTETKTLHKSQSANTLEGMTSMVYEPMLRSGQSLSHTGGDLVLLNGLNDGAEAITDNNLHIYGRGLGRLVAGATGDQNAHIFCQRFNPSLVSVAGTYCLRDSIPEEVIDQPVQVSFREGEGLVFQIMDED